MNRINVRRLYGTLDLLILKVLGVEDSQHGAAIADAIRNASSGELKVEEGALYPALHRLQRSGLIEGEWRISTKRYRAKFYHLTAAGRKELKRALQEWQHHTRAVGQVLQIAWASLS
jgi:transcriptional regulator